MCVYQSAEKLDTLHRPLDEPCGGETMEGSMEGTRHQGSPGEDDGSTNLGSGRGSVLGRIILRLAAGFDGS